MSEARPIGEIVNDLVGRVKRTAIIGELLETLPEAHARKDLVMRLYTGGIITAATAEALIEVYGLEAV